MPPKRKIAPGQDKGFIGETKTKSKPKPYVEHPFETKYKRDRDDSWLNDLFAPEYLKELILERRK